MVSILWIICAIASGIVGHSKSRPILGWVLGIFLGFVGLIITALLPTNQKRKEIIAVKSGDLKKCPSCCELIKNDAVVCRYCGKEISADIKVQKQAPIITRNVDELVGILSKKADIWDHIQAIKDLSQIGGHIAEFAIIKQLDARQLPVRVNAAQALELIGSGKSIPPLQALATTKGADSEAAKRAISKIKERCSF